MNIEDFGNYMVKLDGGEVKLGTTHPLKCSLEERRYNETPVRVKEVAPFYISRYKIVNACFEAFNPKHERVPQSTDDDMPVVDITYGEALGFCRKLNEVTGMNFRLPTEEEWVFAAAPFGWEYPYQEEPYNPRTDWGHVHTDGLVHGAVRIDDTRWDKNLHGLDQMGHNVSEFVYGHRRIPGSINGAVDDGMYCVFKGGNWGHCPYSVGVSRRGIMDVSDRSPRVGFRLAHNV